MVVLTAVLGAASVWLALQVEQDDDVLAFLPRSNPDIQAFYEINEVFGSTEVCIVGIRTPDAFDGAFLGHLKDLTGELRTIEGVDSVLTLTNVADFVKDPNGGIEQGNLVTEVPTTDADEAALREKVLSRDLIVGNLVSAEGDAVVAYAWLANGAHAREVARQVRAAAEKHFPTEEKVWGGGPFISDFIFTATQSDMARLTPWSVAAILLIVMLAFRDVLGTVLGLVATGLGISGARALMVLSGTPFNIVLSSMPVILFAVGSAYAIHMLSKYYAHASRLGPGTDAVVATLVGTTRNVLAAGLTTVAGLWSFLLMDIAPMRSFGLFTGVGVALALVLSVTFVPAVMALFPRPARGSGSNPILRATVEIAVLARQRRVPAMIGLAVIGAVGLGFVVRVDARMELMSFFNPGSPPEQSELFLQEHFGGSQFIQVRVQGDLSDPLALREVARVGDEIATLPHVTAVQGVWQAMELVHDAMNGSRRLPDQQRAAQGLYRFLDSDPSIQRLVNQDRTQALMIVRLDSAKADDLDAALAAVEGLTRDGVLTAYGPASRLTDPARFAEAYAAELRARAGARLRQLGVAAPADLDARIDAWLAAPAPAADPARVQEATVRFLRSPENFVVLDEAQQVAVAAALVALGPDPAPDAAPAALAAALGRPASDTSVGDLAVAWMNQGPDLWREARATAGAASLTTALGVTAPAPVTERIQATLRDKLMERESPSMPVATPGSATSLSWTVSGQPVLYRGLSESVTRNQWSSLLSSLALVLVIMSVLLRSVWSGLLSLMPTVMTIVLVYGAMGATGVHLDIGTSMLASIIVGAGVDYAVHLLAAWEARDDEDITAAVRRAIDETGHAIWTNAGMVGAGFFVLTLGEARPLANVGALTAAAMIIAAVATFAILPVFANKRRYNAEPTLDNASNE